MLNLRYDQKITHGVTKHTSGLEYQYQSGGMNEAFSDIVGSVVEFLVNDSKDQPDFDVGEMLGNKLRSMEYPAEGGRSIDTVCSYKSDLDVHHTSGPLNKAFVATVRACERNGCSDTAGCTVLIGTIFMYANIQLLTTYSTYLDGATATCSIVGEYFDAKSPETQCDAESIVTFIRQGWTSVDIALDEGCRSVTCCSGPCPSITSIPQFPTQVPSTAPTIIPGAPTVAPTVAPASLQPTTAQPIPTQNTSSPTQKPSLPPIDLTEIEGEEGILLRVLRFIFGLFGVLM
jgi:Thermolysin metallopeptidase, alpha-helical domain